MAFASLLIAGLLFVHLPLLASMRSRQHKLVHLLNQAQYSTQVSRRVFNGLGKWPGLKLDGGLGFDSSDVGNRALLKATKLVIKQYETC
jgi:hypothetical protein